jgi:putative transcriptional regulator
MKRAPANALGRLAVCAALAVTTIGAAPDRDPRRLRPGLFLYAAPEQRDPNFVETVVLLVEHKPEGSMGLVVNRPTRVPLRELLRGVEIPASRDLRFYWGGPVEPKAVLALVRTERPSASARSVLPDVHVTGEIADVRAALKEKEPGERLRVYTGYAGWGAGQLAMEVRAGAWVLDRADARSIFAPDTSELWLRVHRILEQLEARASDPPLRSHGLFLGVVGPTRPGEVAQDRFRELVGGGVAADVGGAHFAQRRDRGLLHGTRHLRPAEGMLEHHRDRQDRPGRIGDPLAGDVGRRPVDRLVESRAGAERR